jgi:hypothetical protein
VNRARTKKPKETWTVLLSAPEQRLFCRRCGTYHALRFPMPIWELTAIVEGFDDRHAACSVGAGGLHCSNCGGTGHPESECSRLKAKAPAEWRAGPDVGVSSCTIYGALFGYGYLDHRDSVPRDPSDFGRCHRLLTLFPELHARLGEVAAKHPAWTSLVREWDALTALYLEELPSGRCPKLYARMQQLNVERRGGGT